MKQIRNNWERILFVLTLLVIAFIAMINLANAAQPTKKQVYNKILEWGIEYPEIVWKQAWLESHCGKYSNNLFGFRNSCGYLEFDNWVESIAEYKYWQDTRLEKYKEYKKTDRIDYYDFIWWVGYKDGKRYSKAGKGYIDYLKKIKLRIE